MCAQHKKMKTSWQLSRILQRKCVFYSSQSHHHRSFVFFKVRRFLQKHGTIRTLQYYKRKRVTSKRYSKSWLAGQLWICGTLAAMHLFCTKPWHPYLFRGNERDLCSTNSTFSRPYPKPPALRFEKWGNYFSTHKYLGLA